VRAAHRASERLKRIRGVAKRRRRIDAYIRAHDVRKLQLGSGGNVLPGWLNTDIHDFRRTHEVVYMDARETFPLPDASFDVVFSEHMLEHLSYPDGLHCLRECRRVLRPRGRIRVATPSLERLMNLYDRDLSDLQRRYLRWSIDEFMPHADAQLPGFVLNTFVRAWGHEFVYDAQTLRHALERSGFEEIEERRVGESDDPHLSGLERHLREAPELNEYETLVLEARRP
jgi:predicted SAM-dependent methyltransferase